MNRRQFLGRFAAVAAAVALVPSVSAPEPPAPLADDIVPITLSEQFNVDFAWSSLDAFPVVGDTIQIPLPQRWIEDFDALAAGRAYTSVQQRR